MYSFIQADRHPIDTPLRSFIRDYRRDTGRPLLIGYLPGLYPDRGRYQRMLEVCAEGGLTAMEVGIPAEHPYLDGSIIQKALRKVQGQYQLDPLSAAMEPLAMLKKLQMKSIVMLYNETLEAYGIGRYCREIAAAGVQALLVPNISDVNREEVYASLQDTAVEIVSFIGFSQNDSEIEHILEKTTGFIYLQSTEGGTGGQFRPDRQVEKRLHAVKSLASRFDLPVALGFGINTAEDVNSAEVLGADAVIIGTALVRAAGAGESVLRSYLQSLAGRKDVSV